MKNISIKKYYYFSFILIFYLLADEDNCGATAVPLHYHPPNNQFQQGNGKKHTALLFCKVCWSQNFAETTDYIYLFFPELEYRIEVLHFSSTNKMEK